MSLRFDTSWIQVDSHFAGVLVKRNAFALFENLIVITDSNLLTRHVLCDFTSLRRHAVASLTDFFATTASLFRLASPLLFFFSVDKLLAPLICKCVFFSIRQFFRLSFFFQFFELSLDSFLVVNLLFKSCNLLSFLLFSLKLSLMLHRSRLFNLLLDLLDALQLCSTALCISTLATNQFAYFRGVLHETRYHEFFSLFFQTINKHVIDISWCQLRLGSI